MLMLSMDLTDGLCVVFIVVATANRGFNTATFLLCCVGEQKIRKSLNNFESATIKASILSDLPLALL
jgi:hypothetical protein